MKKKIYIFILINKILFFYRKYKFGIQLYNSIELYTHLSLCGYRKFNDIYNVFVGHHPKVNKSNIIQKID